jgi:hypothetical protein
VLGATALSAYAANVCSGLFNPHDDLQAYFVFPEKMVQTGAIGEDPYSERRIVSLGGMSFLHALVLAVADTRYLVVVDPGVSLLLAVALVPGLARDARARPWAAALGVLVLLAVPPPRVNVTSLASGLALFLTLYRTLRLVSAGSRAGDRGTVLVALVAAGICSLKSTFVPACALLVVGAYLFEGLASRSPVAALRRVALAGGLTLLLLAPWMLALRQSSGTLLYPFLGRGFHGSAYGSSWEPGETVTPASLGRAVAASAADPRVAPVWILGAGLLLRRRAGGARGVPAAFLAASLTSHVALTAMHPTPAYRYSWAFLFACLLVLLVGSVAPRARRGWPAVRAAAPGLLALATLGWAHARETREHWAGVPATIRDAVEQSRSPGFKSRWARRYARMQQAVPAGETLLTRLEYPFTLDFSRQRIFVADYPGGSSPPPGMPSFEGAEALAGYLLGQGVRYVAYSYRSEAGFDLGRWGHRQGEGTHPWTRAQARLAFDFQRSLDELGRTRERVFDDGDVFVLDLARPSPPRDGADES